MAILKSNQAVNSKFFERASDVFRKMAGRTPNSNQAEAYRSGMQKFGSAIANQDYEATSSIMKELIQRGKELGK
jgi:soluble cytochrome b562